MKKTLQPPKADDEQRLCFQTRLQKYREEGCEIIDVDESGFAKDMPRCRGYSIRGKRCYGKQAWQAKGLTHVIGALLNNKLMTICTFQSTIDSEVFNAWVTQDLLPKTSLGAIIVMDNASFHKKEATQTAIEEAGCTLEFLPTYSPDLNPIEHKWAQEKAIRRKLRCSVDEIFQQAFI
ncbi:IS630 family transposase [unidentified bacterial endosymbiont]|uniref:IS630 family transposase n=1 Tax=unidentified bacterial endosymbiont TaxID=2355 RepID=UPI0026465C34|nr:IS630 family transposase [unidentified bacterial endosymbiont]